MKTSPAGVQYWGIQADWGYLEMHRFETYRRTERISYPPFTSHFPFSPLPV